MMSSKVLSLSLLLVTAIGEPRTCWPQRFGDPHRVSNACKSHLKNWSQIGERQSNYLKAFSDFLGQCKEAMTSKKFLSDLDPTEVLKQAFLIFILVPPCPQNQGKP